MTIASNVSQCLATIKAIESQLSILALNSLEDKAKKTFHESMIQMGEIKEDLMKRKTELEIEEPQYKPS